MTDDASRHDGFADVINLIAAPIAGGIRTVEQFKRGVEELFRAVDNLNRTMENLNEAASRINRLIGDIEQPVRAMMPQITRSVHAADEITKLLEGPIRVAAPNIEKIVDTLSSPGFSSLPNQLGEFINTIGDVSKRLGPLTQFAESAGGLFGGLRLPGMGAKPPAPAPQPAQATTPTSTAPVKKSLAKRPPTTTTKAAKKR
jgi:hypothetical protein